MSRLLAVGCRHRMASRGAATGITLVVAGCAAAGTGGPASGPDAPEGARTWERVVAPFSVTDASGEPYALPFLGGFDVPRPQFVDVDGDGDLDLFVQERTGELIFLENVGSRGNPEYRWRTDRYQDLDVGEWSRFVDLDGDGRLDLLAEERFSYVRWYRNEGPPEDPRFVLAVDSLRAASGEPIFSDRQNIPNVADIDCNGRPDLFLGRVDGTVTRYESTGVGPGGAPRFELVTDRFEGIEIVGQIAGGPPSSARHGANSMAFADLDDDGDPDLLWGDFFEPGVLLIENRGRCSAPDLRSDPRPVPTVPEDSLLTSGYNVAVPVDIDADGDLDLAVGVLGGAFNPNRTSSDNFHMWIQEDGGRLRLATERYLGQIDIGSESVPALGDLDADGDLDLLVGNRLDPSGGDASRVYVFENVGGPRSPELRLTDTLALGDAYHYAPALADLDADGAPDLVVGTWNDGVLLFRNEGTPQEADFVPAGTLVEITRGSYTTPALADVDGDGDLDLMVGESSGELNLYRNEGTPTEPRFVLVSDAFQAIDVGRRSHPSFFDVDGDGHPDLVVGSEDPGALVLLNDGNGAFRAVEGFDLPLPAYGAPAYGDLDGDGVPEVVSGGLAGGLIYLEAR